MKAPSLAIAFALLLTAAVPATVSLGAPGQTVSITMRDFSYTPDRITVQAGIPVVFTLINKGKVTHEFMIYDRPKPMTGEMLHEWAERHNYLHGLTVDATGAKVRRMGRDVVEVRVAAGRTATLKLTPVRKGTFELGCMVEGHYQAGQHGVLIVK